MNLCDFSLKSRICFQVAQVPRVRPSTRRKLLVTLVPPQDDEGKERNLPPPTSVTAEENEFRKEVALSSAKPEEPSVAPESAACAAKESLVDLSDNEEEPGWNQQPLLTLFLNRIGLRGPKWPP